MIESKNPVSARALARVIVRIISMSFALGNICQIMSRNMHLPILNRSTWDGPVDLNDGVLYELKFWLDNIDTLPFRTLAPIDRTPDIIVFSDASSLAGAAVTLESVNKVVHCMFSEQEIRESSTYRELKQYSLLYID